jgi:hypothetical protein
MDKLEAWLPIGLTILLLHLVLPRIGHEVFWVDGPSQIIRGWPLPWGAHSVHRSAATEVYLLPLAINTALAGVMFWLAVRRHGRPPAPLRRGLIIAVWSVAAPLLLWTGFLYGVGSLLVPDALDWRLWYSDWPVDRINGPMLTP